MTINAYVNVLNAILEGRHKNKVPHSPTLFPPIDEDNLTGRQVREIKGWREKQQNLYNFEEARLRALFKTDLEAEYGVVSHPKRDKLFDLAWEHGHSSGYTNVAHYYSDFVELIK